MKKMGRPKKNTEQKKQQMTYRGDRDPALKENSSLDDEMLTIIKTKLVEAKEVIKNSCFKKETKEIILYATAYKKLVDILNLYVPGNKKEEKSLVDDLWKK
jgi:hypothetical protein